MTQSIEDLISVPEAARQAGVARNTMYRAARKGAIRSVKIGRDYFVYAGDIERWRMEAYRPQMAARKSNQTDEGE